MKTVLLLTGSGCSVVLTSHGSVTDAAFVEALAAKGIQKFIAREIPTDLARARYAGHFTVVEHDLTQVDDLRVLDEDGERAFRLFSFEEMGAPVEFEAQEVKAERESHVRTAEDLQ